eukprot:TRINITY_DN12529_c1_g1_i1.p1 TRINITY_DN12529_c1_g1~~TRINITY_DN12529_c1_g1_i1.p1  ORF type:complete len:246 (-),score=44.10 TRINITY_DN12529_c1_g1_i1:97-834(-)
MLDSNALLSSLAASLPGSGRDLDHDGAAYWDGRYTKDLSSPYEWFRNFDDLRVLIEEVTSGDHSKRILHPGCGNSLLPEQMYDAGYHQFTNIDFSSQAIKQMRERRSCESRPGLEWRQMDALAMDFASESFDLVLDKGLLDALACSNFNKFAAASDSARLVATYLQAVKRVLRDGGCFLCVSYDGPEDNMKFFKADDVMPRVRHVELFAEQSSAAHPRGLQTHHAYIWRKRAPQHNQSMVLDAMD